MKFYSGKLRLAGSVQNEVPKKDMSAAEVILLRHLHGDDAVVISKHEGDRRRSSNDERDRLIDLYGEKIVTEIFGPYFRELPPEVEDIEEQEEIIPTPKKRARKAKATEDSDGAEDGELSSADDMKAILDEI